MSIIRAACLAAVILVSASLHAQNCSGGPEGGMDATGSQCNAPGSVGEYPTEPVAVPSAQLSGGRWSSLQRPPLALATQRLRPQFRSTAIAIPVSRLSVGGVTVIAPPKTIKIEVVPEATCSGGADGGMDATGNQCNVQSAAAGNAIATNFSIP